MTLRIFSIFFIAAGIFIALPAAADPPWQDDSGDGYRHEHEWHKHEHRHQRRHERDDEAEDEDEGGYRDQGGPPPWAPAHGYRRNHHHDDTQTVVVIHEPDRDAPVYNDREDAAVQFRTTSQAIGISAGSCNRQVVGTVVGGILGGVIGNNVAHGEDKNFGTAAGALIGAIVGNQIGRNMDNADANCTNQALERAPDGQVVSWRNPDTGFQYAVTPYKTYQRDDGRYCREYTTVVKSSRTRQYRQTACRTDQGVWQKQ